VVIRKPVGHVLLSGASIYGKEDEIREMIAMAFCNRWQPFGSERLFRRLRNFMKAIS